MAYFGTTGVAMWVNFRGTGSISIRESYRIASLTDHGTGNYNLNFSFTVVDSSGNLFDEFAAVGSVGDNAGFTGGYNPERMIKFSNSSNGGVRIHCRSSTGGSADETSICCMIAGVYY